VCARGVERKVVFRRLGNYVFGDKLPVEDVTSETSFHRNEIRRELFRRIQRFVV